MRHRNIPTATLDALSAFIEHEKGITGPHRKNAIIGKVAVLYEQRRIDLENIPAAVEKAMSAISENYHPRQRDTVRRGGKWIQINF